MASAWGASFGLAWGSSWGAIAVEETGAGGGSKKRKYLLEYRNRTLLFDSIAAVEAFLATQQKSAIKATKALPERVKIDKGVALKAKPQVIKIKTDDADVRALVDAINRKLQSEFDRTRQILLTMIAQREQDEEDAIIALML